MKKSALRSLFGKPEFKLSKKCYVLFETYGKYLISDNSSLRLIIGFWNFTKERIPIQFFKFRI